ncbi:MAG: DUF5658 family protein [Nanoarchaeota archaeon]
MQKKVIVMPVKELGKADMFLFDLVFFLGTIVIIGNLLDMATTYFALQQLYTYEENPVMKFVITECGWASFFLIKGVFCLVFFPIRYSPINWVLRFSIRSPYYYIKQFNIGVILTLHIVFIAWFWYLGITNLKDII